MNTDRPAPAVAAEAWLEMVRQLLSGDAGTLPLDAAERAALLDLARVAAHTSERITAPLSTYLAGLALASIPAAERAERIAALVRRLEEQSA
jgi:hypothetical protein